MSLQEFSHMDRWRAEDKRDYESKLEAIRNSDSGIKLAKLREGKKQTDTSGLDEESHVNSKKLGDIPQNEISRISGKVPKSQEVWDKFLCKLEEEEVPLEETIGCEDRKQFIADCGFVHTDAAIIATRWGKLLVSDNTSKGPDCNAMLQNDMIETAEMKHFPYLATIIPKEKEWRKFEESLQNSAVETKENLRSIFHPKITSKTISHYDACVLNYLLSDDMDKLAFDLLNPEA